MLFSILAASFVLSTHGFVGQSQISTRRIPARTESNLRRFATFTPTPVKKGTAPPKITNDDRGGGGAKYRVLLFNDPVNTKEYVARMLMTKCKLSENKAFDCMSQAHQHGMGLVGIWLKDVAEKYTVSLQNEGLAVTMVPNE